MDRQHRLLLPGLFLAVFATSCLWAPTGRDPLYCDEDTPCENPNRPFCDLNADFDPDEGLARTCIASPYEGACNAATPCASGVCGPDDVCVDCVDSTDCGGDTPVCKADHTCGSCADAEDPDAVCEAADAAFPYCSVDGSCIECKSEGDCSGATPVCSDSGACVACENHGDCDSGLCNGDGTCADASTLIFVDADGGSDISSCGAADAPCLTIGGGLEQVTATRNRVLVRKGTYPEQLEIAGIAVSIEAVGNVEIYPSLASENSGIRVVDGADVSLIGVKLRQESGGTNSHGIDCEPDGGANPNLTLLAASVSGFAGRGINGTSCDTRIERSTVSGNNGGGVRLTDCSFSIVNNFIYANGTQFGENATSFGGVDIQNSGVLDAQLLQFNTIVDNSAGAGADSRNARVSHVTTPGTCANNLVYGGGGGMSIVDGNCTWTYSLVEGGIAGSGNIMEAPTFVDAAGDDYHLATGSRGIDEADPSSTITIDFDGDTRPQGDAPDMGADEAE